MFPDLIIPKTEKSEMIKSLLKYNPNKNCAQDTKKIKIIEQELKQKFLRKNHSEQKFSLMITNEQKDVTDRYEQLQNEKKLQSLNLVNYNTTVNTNQASKQLESNSNTQSMPQLQQQTIINNKTAQKGNKRILYEMLQNQFKDYVVGGQSNYKFYAQQKMNQRNQEKFGNFLSPQNQPNSFHFELVSNLKSTSQNSYINGIAATEKAKRFIFDKSSKNKSTQKMGILLPSPLVFKNQIGLSNQSELKRYENIIGKLQQLALRLDLNKSQLQHQRPVLRNFVELHSIKIPNFEDLDEKLIQEEKIINYIEQRKFLEINDQIKSLKSIEDHFEFAVHGHIKVNANNTISQLEVSKNNISMNYSQSMNFIVQPESSLSRDHSKQNIVYNEGCGIALVNEKIGKFDTSTIQYFETGISLQKVLGYMKVVADIKNYVILEGNLMKIYKFQESQEGKGKWVVLNNTGEDLQSFRFDSKTLYAISAYQNLTHN
eukprot:403331312